MKPKRKIAIVTGTRAEYGLLYHLMREIDQDPTMVLQIIAAGMHLSPEFGLTYKLIEADHFTIAAKVEMLVSSDTASGIAKSIALGVIGFNDAFERLAPDLIILLGDRFEALAAAQTALIHRIPVAHIHGGELSEGAIDDAIRHAISKMSHLHFVAAEPYKHRVMQLGEDPAKIFNVGAPGLERIQKSNLLSRTELEDVIGFKLGNQNFLITYQPSTLEIQNTAKTLQAIFRSLDSFPDAKIIFTKANADEAGKLINNGIDEFVKQQKHRAIAFMTLGDLNYISLLQFVNVVIGNSSSGIIEVPYFKKPTVNIGNRQRNRLRATSVIDCTNDEASIIKSLNLALSLEFKSILQNTVSLYKVAPTSNLIKTIIKDINFDTLLMKQFHNLTDIMASEIC